MCRTTGFHGSQYGDRNRITIKSFFVKLSTSTIPNNNNKNKNNNNKKLPLPESLTLLFLPRIDGTDITVSGSKIRPDLAAYVTLHRSVEEEEEKEGGAAVFGSRERVRVGEGVRFEVYLREERVVEGLFRKDEEEEWRLECSCGLIGERSLGGGGCADMAVAEVCVGLDGHVALFEKVEMVMRRRRRRRRCDRLELIPEARVEEDEGWDGGSCCCDCDRVLNGGDSLKEDGLGGARCIEDVEMGLDLDLEGVRWAVDVGIWVMCFGVGLLVSRASAKNFRRIS